MTEKEKIDIIFSKVSKIETNVAVIMERDNSTEKRLNSHDGKIGAIEEAVNAYKIERAKLIGIAVASGSIFSMIGAVILWIVGWFKSN